MRKKFEEVFSSDKITVLSDKKSHSRIVNFTCPIYQTNFLTDARQIFKQGYLQSRKIHRKKIQDERVSVESSLEIMKP